MEFPKHYPTCRTINGRPVILFTDQAKGTYPLIGAYYSGEVWIPKAWTKEGYFREEVTYHDLNLVFDTEKKAA